MSLAFTRLISGLIVGGAGYLGWTGKLSDVIETIKTDSQNKSTKSAVRNQPPIMPRIVVAPILENKQQSYLMPIGCVSCIGLAAYFYYIEGKATKQVISKVEETADETQDIVTKCDANNAQRFATLDAKNDNRIQTAEMEIRAEQRAGFATISESLYCLTQVAIQTLTVLARNGDNECDDNFSSPNEQLLAYADKAQQMAETVLSEEYLLKTKNTNLQEIRAEIQLRNSKKNVQNLNMQSVTPGGPDDDSDVVTENPYITNISYKSNNDNSMHAISMNLDQSWMDKIQSKTSAFKENIKFEKYKKYYVPSGCFALALSCYALMTPKQTYSEDIASYQ